MVPVIGGKELDLHVLYVEVTKRGGFSKVVLEKKWREVSSVFNFSSTTTSASYVLRKHYESLLHNYEKAYFCKLQGPSSSPTVDQAECSSKRIRNCPDLNTGDAIGTIDGKFDCGYLVTVKLGSEVLNGVLYHADNPGHSISLSQPCTAVVPYTGEPHRSNGRNRRERRRKRRRWGDPTRPKPNRSGYNFFFAEKHLKLKSLYPDREREFTKMIGQSWSKLSPEERMVYQRIGLMDKERYKRELDEYNKNVKLKQIAEGRS